jgi:hypothetical protein
MQQNSQRVKISEDQRIAIKEFAELIRKLRNLGVIRTDQFLGDLGEFLASREYEIKLAKSARQKGHDTEGTTDRVQIKFHNSQTRKNIELGAPDRYDRIIVVIGPDSILHPRGEHSGKYCFYEFTSVDVKEKFKTVLGNYSSGKMGIGKPSRTMEI